MANLFCFKHEANLLKCQQHLPESASTGGRPVGRPGRAALMQNRNAPLMLL